jgi:hypothetical protein
MVGTFEGTRPNDSRLVTVRINSDGAMNATVGEIGRRTNRESITYRRDLFTVGGFDYRVERSRNGFLAVATDRRNGEISFRRTGDYVDDRASQSNSRPPDWMIGHFDGRASKNGQIFNLRVTSDGKFTAKDRLHGDVASYFNVSYRRSTLTIDNRDYTVERTRDGFRAIPINEEIDRNGRSRDKYGRIDFRRIEIDEER